MPPAFFLYDEHRVGMWVDDETMFDVCGLRHPATEAGPCHARGCLIEAVLDHERIADEVNVRAAPRLRPARILAPVQRPLNVFGAPVNYREHQGELGVVRSTAKADVYDLGLFVKASGSVSGPTDPVELPALDDREFHYEGEIAVVIGRPAEDVSSADALAYVAGFTGALDITMRLEEDRREERSMRKSYKTFTPVGPAVLPLADPASARALSLTLYLNGERRQHGTLSQLIMPVDELVALASSIVPLEPGDLILTGTPHGVGPLAPGDLVELAIDGLPRMSLAVTRKRAGSHPSGMLGSRG